MNLIKAVGNKVVSAIRNTAKSSGFAGWPYMATYIDYTQYRHELKQRSGGLLSLSRTAQRYFDVVRENGVCIIEDFWDAEKCKMSRDEVDRVIEAYPEYVHSSARADRRVFGANHASDLIETFSSHAMLGEIATAYNEEPTRTAFTLAAKMPTTEGNLGSGEGWHRDAFFRQFKAILYLSDVKDDNGPFQYIHDSHRPKQVLRDIWSGRLRYMQSRLSDEEVERILYNSPERLNTYTAKAGTLILVDSSSIHRGMPIRVGTRYALTNYYFPERNIDAAMFEKFKVLPLAHGQEGD